MTIRRSIGPLGTNCYFHVFAAGDGSQRALVIDPAHDGRRLAEELSARGALPAGIVFTHGHLDHTAGAADFIRAYAERGVELRCAVHAEDAPFLGESGYAKNLELFRALGDEGFFRSIVQPLPEAAMLLKEGDEPFGSGLRVVHTPGHTRGSICLACDAERLAYTGDTLFRGGVGRTDSPDGDEEALEASLRRLVELLPEDYECLPGHGAKTSIGAERRALFG